MNSVCCCSLSVGKKFFEEGDPLDLFCPALDPPLGGYGQNIFMHVPGHEHFIPTKFRKYPLRGSVVKAGYVFPYIPLRKVTIPIYRCHICALYVTYNFYRGVIGGGIGGYRYRGIIGE